MYTRKLFFLFLLPLMLSKVHSQDVHFSQFYNAPLLLNPALTGLMKNDLRIHANYRSQWGSVATPFQTMALSVDMPILQNQMRDDVMGVGLMLLNDKAGAVNLRQTQVQLSYAFHKSLNKSGNHFFGLGAQLGYVRHRFDPQSLLFDNQFNGEDLDPSLPNGENRLIAQGTYLDFSAGVQWSYSPDRYTSYYAGFALAHLNRPTISFFNVRQENMYRKQSVYLGAEFRMNYLMSLLPRAVWLRQGPNQEHSFGALLRMNMKSGRGNEDPTSIYFGSMHRLGDAQVILLRFDYGPFGFSFSYDWNISGLNQASQGRGASEIALMYRGQFTGSSRPNPVRCPGF
ncbi:MAG: PorP/SprF family type IX secretion system membrane protein [Bacteroidota bacterium]